MIHAADHLIARIVHAIIQGLVRRRQWAESHTDHTGPAVDWSQVKGANITVTKGKR